MLKKLLIAIVLFYSFVSTVSTAHADRDCTTLGTSDYNTFKEYCYKITDSYLDLRNTYEVDKVIDNYTANRILNYAKTGLNYLPDSLSNKNYYNKLKTAIEKGNKYPDDVTVFSEIKDAIEDYLHKTTIQEITGKIDVYPATGNAPHTVTLRADVKDPTGTKLDNYNYTWWIKDGTRRKIIGNRVYLNYTFREEGNYAIFLDVTSNHRNNQGNIDVLSFSEKATIEVSEKVASTIIRINSKSLNGNDTMKFTPEEAAYGLLIDASSSTPASGTKFVRTEWDFGNGVRREYNGSPKLERVVYAVEGEYNVQLKMKTNSGKVVERNFNLIIRNPIATIKGNSFDGYLSDKFTFSANVHTRNSNLTFAWEIVDLKKDTIIFNKSASTFTYNFPEKGRYNVKLTVTSPSGEMDYDNKIVYINSRAPTSSFTYTIPNPSQPQIVFLDGGASFDLDVSDNGKLQYNWIVDGNRVELDNPSRDGSSGYYEFTDIGNHDVVLEVLDPDDMMSQSSRKIDIKSVLGVNFYTFPRVTQVGAIAKFVAESPNAKFFEWDFGDNVVEGGGESEITHKYKQSGIYNVTLTVVDNNDQKNTYTKKVYVGDANKPYAFLSVENNSSASATTSFDESACNNKGAYVLDRITNVTFSANESLDVTGKKTGLKYSWKVGNDYYTKSSFSKRFDELGCVPIKLTVRSEKTGKSDTTETYIDVRNIKPTLSSLDVQVKDTESDPVIVKVKAVGAEDKDGVIQSYLWYYYTDNTSEPQDFRATRSDNTTFVIPKVSGNYYFVVVMKDNNEERVSSEDISSRYFITLSGDNQNTPIIDLRASDTSISVGEEVTFTVTAKNILTQDILKDSKIYWDFDGDGFYDKETRSGTVTHKYTKSGENINAKVKVTHKGFSNTRSVVINISNVLKPNFRYLSIGNEVVFFDQSSGSIDTYTWDLGDGNTVTNNGSFRYTYEDEKPAHIVKLKVSSNGKTEEVSKKVVRNFMNFIQTKKQDISLFSDYSIGPDGIKIPKEVEYVSLYIKTRKDNVENYAIDYDVTSDSDLNGGEDDDVDNKDKESFYSGGPAKIPLNKFKEQEIRVMLLSNTGSVIGSKNVVIHKDYIEDDPINPDEITFENIPDSIKAKFEQIKAAVLTFPKEYRLQGLEYIQRLQEEWNDNRAKTNIILEFEGFNAETQVDGWEDLNNLLESLLIDGQEKEDGRAIALAALKNLLPKDVSCSENLQTELSEELTCYDLLQKKLDAIYETNDVEERKALGKDIMFAVANYKKITKKEVDDFKAILLTLIHDGVENVPQEDVDDVVSGNTDGDNSVKQSGGFVSVFLKLLQWLFYIILVIGVLIGIFFGLYKLFNKDSNKSFTEFISDTTHRNRKTVKNEVSDVLQTEEVEEEYDPLAAFSNDTGEKQDKKTDSQTKNNTESTSSPDGNKNENKGKAPDWLTGATKDTENKKTFESPSKEFSTDGKIHEKVNGPDVFKFEDKEEKLVVKNPQSKTEEKNKNTGAIPAWLQGSMGEQDKKELNSTNNENKAAKEEKDTIPSKTTGLNNSTEKEVPKDVKKEAPKDSSKETSKTIVEEKKVDVNKEEDDKLIINSGVPDWLKGAVDKKEATPKDSEKKPQSNQINTKQQGISKDNTANNKASKTTDTTVISKELDTNKKNVDNNENKANTVNQDQTAGKGKSSLVVEKNNEKSTKTESADKKTSSTKDLNNEKKDSTKTQTTKKSSTQGKETKASNNKENKLETKEEIEDFIKIKDEDIVVHDTDDSLPDWLVQGVKKDNSQSPTKKEVDSKKQTESKKTTTTKKSNTKIETSKKEAVKDSGAKTKEDINDNKKETLKPNVKNDDIKSNEKKENTKKVEVKQDDSTKKNTSKKTASKDKKAAKKKVTPEVEVKKSKESKENKENKENKDDNVELWDDGMKIPDWLKTDE